MAMHQSVKIGDSEIGFLARGSAASDGTIVLLHGIGASASFWQPFLDHLKEHPAIAWDAPGYGGSTPLSPSAPDAAAYAEELAKLLKTLSLKRIHLVGHSWGALIAAAFAERHANSLLSLALINPPPGFGGLPEGERKSIVDGRIAKLDELGPQGLAAAMAPMLVSPSAPSDMIEAAGKLGDSLHAHGMAQATRMLGSAKLMQSLAHGADPFLVIAGADDKVTPPSVAEDIARACPQAKIVMIQQCGHLAPFERREETLKALNDFWSSRTITQPSR